MQTLGLNDQEEPSPALRSFRRLAREHARLDGLELYARVVASTGAPLADPSRIDAALADIRGQLVDVTGQESTLHGWRAQALFEAVVASLGGVELLKQEDAGDVFFAGDDLQPPDFRVVTRDHKQFHVEVKNFHQKQPLAPFRLRRKDMERLRRYADVVQVTDLKVAIYWSRWNLWTLTDATVFAGSGSAHLELSLPDAMKANEMGSLGDRTVATEWPIGLTFYSDPSKPRRVNDKGEAPFTIERAEYSVAGKIVTSPAEQRIVHRLMLNGGWQEDATTEVVDGEIISASFMFSPEQPPPFDQQFAMHRPLSSIFSGIFHQATIDEEGEITELRIDIDPGALAGLIPDDYDGEVLKIWRFHQRPA